MKEGLVSGVEHRFEYVVPENKTVPALYPEASEFQAMPAVFATGFMVGLMEWTCVQLLTPYFDEGEGSLGTYVDVSHVAATPPGHKVTVDARVERVDGRRVWFSVKAHDERDLIGEGRHERAVVSWDRFNARVAEKAKEAVHG